MREEFERKKKQFEKLKFTRDSHVESLERDERTLQVAKDNLVSAERGLFIIQEVARQTQQNLEYHISSLVTTALASVFPEPPEFSAKIEIARNKTTLDLSFLEFGEKSKPLDSSGGGPIDIASFALRTSFWSLNKNRPTFVLDEPFKFVSPGLQHKVSEMLKMLSEKLGLQIIMVSHAEEVNYAADKTFQVEKVGQFSRVKIENG